MNQPNEKKNKSKHLTADNMHEGETFSFRTVLLVVSTSGAYFYCVFITCLLPVAISLFCCSHDNYNPQSSKSSKRLKHIYSNTEFYIKMKECKYYLVTSTRTGVSGSSSNTVTISLNEIKNVIKIPALINR